MPERALATGSLDIQREADRLVALRFGPPGVVITDDLFVVRFRGKTGPYLAPAARVPSMELLRMLRNELRAPVRQAVEQARALNRPMTAPGLCLVGDEAGGVVDIDVLPMPTPGSQQRHFVLLFRDVTWHEALPMDDSSRVQLAARPDDSSSLLEQVTSELSSTRNCLESVLERLETSNGELRSADEEATSSNEELRSTNEVLKLAKEELQKATERLAAAQQERATESEQRIIAYQEKLRRLSFDAALAEERERRRIASDLHDRIGQSLALSKMKLEGMQPSSSGRTAVDDAIDLLAQSIVDTRTLIFDLSPPILYELGLEDALSWLAEDLGKRWGMTIDLETDGVAKPLDDAAAALVYRAVRELLTNVLKHAHAPVATLALRRSGADVEIEVRDRGVGFDPQAAQARPGHGRFGLFNVREQMSRLGGTVEVESAEMQGTRVRLRLPLKLA